MPEEGGFTSRSLPKVNFRPTMELMPARIMMVYKTASKSRAGVFHYTMRYVNDYGVITFECSCEGQQSAGHCWHVDKLREEHGN
jgi:hypothetical protein